MKQKAIRYGCGIAVVGAVTTFSWFAFGDGRPTNVVMTYLLGVVIAAMRLGYGPSLLVAAASVASYDFFFTQPRFSLLVYDPRDLLTFAIMLFVAFVISNLTERLRTQVASTRRRAEQARRAELRAETERLRNALLSSVSHDLRGPLGVVQGAASVLAEEDGALPVDRRRDLLRTISSEVHRLNRLVSNLVDMTALEAGALRAKKEWNSIEEVIGVALGRLETLLADRDVETDVPRDLPLFAFDASLIEEVLVNLIENATKHTPLRSPIRVAAHRVGEALEVMVADRGEGLRHGEEERLFEKFYRGTKKQPGMGLGLTICRGIVTAHGGAIRAENRPGGGALFRFVLPGSAQAGPTPPRG